jgi:VWFA-related protein
MAVFLVARSAPDTRGALDLGPVRGLCWAVFFRLVLGSIFSSALLAQAAPPATSEIPKAAAHIDLSTLGYREPSRLERLTDEASVSLDFVDRDHVLLTFNPRKLVKRGTGCPSDRDGHTVHAAILEVPSGKVVSEGDWYLCDEQRYLWPLGSGRFLLRQWNSLYRVDSTLEPELLMTSPEDLLWVTVTADHKQVMTETAEKAKSGPAPPPGSAPAQDQAKPHFVLEFLDLDSLAPVRTLRLDSIVDLEGTSAGYANFIHRGDLWLLRFGPTPEERRNIARVRSRCVPEVFYPSNQSLVIGRCSLNSNDYSVSAFTVSGRRLWRQRWDRYRYYPAISHSADSSRFGVSTLRLAAGSVAPPGDDADRNHGLEQQVQIFETASGNPVETVAVSAPVLNGQNFSLSPDGRQLAVLAESAIELYDLPPIGEEEQAKFAALKADAPGLYLLPAQPDADSQPGTAAGSPAEPATAGAAEGAGNAAPGPAPEPPRPSASIANPTGDAVPPAPSAGHGAPAAAPAPTASTGGARDQGQPLVTFKAGTQAVVVDVVVTDAKGHPVRGLPVRDFQLAEDGSPQKISYFREFSGAHLQPAQTAPRPAKPSLNVFTNDTQEPEPGAVTVLLLDLLNTPSGDQPYARGELVKFLKSKGQDSQFALCTLTGEQSSHLRLIQGFTSDENLLLAAVNGKKSDTKNVRWQTARAATQNAADEVRQFAQGDPLGSWQNLLSGIQNLQAEQQASDTDARVGITMDALSQLARYLAGIPGRKNLIWLSGSFPVGITPGEDLDNPAPGSRNYSNLIKRASNLLAQGHVAVYPVDVRGLTGSSISASNHTGLAPAGARQAIGVAAGVISSNGSNAIYGQSVVSPNETFLQDSMQALAAQSAEFETLNQIASETGGKAFYNTNGIGEAVATASEQGSNYYTLSYTPANRNYNGRFRKIKIALADKGYHLHYRPGYFAEDPSTPVNSGEVLRNLGTVAMQHGSPQSRQVLFEVRVVPLGAQYKANSSKAGKPSSAAKAVPSLPSDVEVQHYGIDYAVNSSDLRFVLQGNETYRSALQLMIAGFDDEGRQLSGLSALWASDLGAADYRDVISGGVHIHQEVDVPVAAASLRLGIADQMSNHLGTVELPLPVPAPADVPRTVRHSLPEIEPD